jgi:nucleoside-diphosphate-sugar epimerase
MRITIIGGTEFIGRRTVEVLTERGDDVMVVHRGKTEPADLPRCEHVHVERAAFASVAADVTAFQPDAIVDTIASSAADRDAVLPHLPDVPLVVLSSMDVYRFFELLHADDDTPLPVPFDESGELRRGRYPYAGRGIGEDDYEKLDVEPAYLERGASVLRLGMVYGPRDPQKREEFVLRASPGQSGPHPDRAGGDDLHPDPCGRRRGSDPRCDRPARCRRRSGVQHR